VLRPTLIMPENTIVITDTSCFIILDKIDALYLLPQLFAHVITTPEIAKEYGKTLPDWVTIKLVQNNLLQSEFNDLIDPGEASAIALAAEIKCDYLLTDDRAARKFAEQRGVAVKGSAGVLLYAKQQRIIPLLRPYLQLIQQTNFRISPSLVDRLIKEAGEE
jgi:predicted nucleic acid-binding protein